MASAGSSPDSTSITSTRGAIRRIIATALRRGVWQGYGTPTRVPGWQRRDLGDDVHELRRRQQADDRDLADERAHLLRVVRGGDDGVDAALGEAVLEVDDGGALDPLDAVAERRPQLRDERLRLGLAALHEQQPAGADRGALRGAREGAGRELVGLDALARGLVERAVEDRLERVVVGARQRVGDDGADLAAGDDPALVLQPRVDGADGVRVDAQRRRHLADRGEALAGLVFPGRDRVPELPEELRPERYGQV